VHKVLDFCWLNSGEFLVVSVNAIEELADILREAFMVDLVTILNKLWCLSPESISLIVEGSICVGNSSIGGKNFLWISIAFCV